MLNKKTPRQEQLDKIVESKIKSIGLDALFHVVDTGRRNRRAKTNTSAQKPEHPSIVTQLKNRLPFLSPQNILYTLQTIYSDKLYFIIGLSIDSVSIKIIELQDVKGSVRLDNAQYIPIPQALTASEEKTEQFITETLAEILDPAVTRNAYVCLVIPRSKVITKFFSLPTVDPLEIENMVTLEAEHHVPFPLNECIFDYATLYREQEKTHLIFVSIRKDEINKYLRLLNKAGLKPSSIDISALTLHNTLRFEKNTAQRITHIYIGHDHIDINVVMNNQLKASRAAPWGCASLASSLCTNLNVNAEIAAKMQKENGIVIKKSLKNDVSDSISRLACQWADKLIIEIKETIRHYQFQDGLGEIEGIILTGEGARLLNLDQYLQDQLGIKVARQEPPQMFAGDSSNEPFRRLFYELSPLAGLAGKFENKDPSGVNLLPESLRYTFEKKKQNVRQLTTLIIASIAFLAMMIVPTLVISIRDQYIRHLDNKLAKMSPQATKLRALSDKAQAIEDYQSVSRSCIEVLRELSLLVSLDILINQFTFEQNDHVTLVGEAESHSSVVELSRAIRESDLFEDAILKYTRKKSQLEKNVDFEIICKLKK